MDDATATTPKIVIKHRYTGAALYEYQPDEAERVRADIEYQKHRERWREDRALALQWRYGDGQ